MRSSFQSKSIFGLLVEVILIGVGVFLGLLANQWHDDRQHREMADVSLRYFREEIAINKQAIERVSPYHAALSNEVGRFLQVEGPKTMQRFQSVVHFRGVEPVEFERTAWDLALATQSLPYLPPKLAYAISRVYTRQQAFQTLQNGFLYAVLAPTTFSAPDMTGFATSMDMYLHDVNIQEPQWILRATAADPWLAAHPPRIEWLIGGVPPAEVPPDDPIVTTALGAARAVGRENELGGLENWHDGATLIVEAGIPSICLGPGDINVAHTIDESVPIVDLVACAQTIAVTAMRYCRSH